MGKSLEDEAEVYQWIEYGEVYLLGQAIPQVINDLLPVKILLLVLS